MAEETSAFELWMLVRYAYWALTLAIGIVAAIKLRHYPGGKLVAACYLLLVPMWFGTGRLYHSMAEAEEHDPYVGIMRAGVISQSLGTLASIGIGIGIFLLPGPDTRRRD